MWYRTNLLKVHYLLLGDALGLVLVDALGFLVNALSVVLVDMLIVCNQSCKKSKNYSSINMSMAV